MAGRGLCKPATQRSEKEIEAFYIRILFAHGLQRLKFRVGKNWLERLPARCGAIGLGAFGRSRMAGHPAGEAFVLAFVFAAEPFEEAGRTQR